MNRRPNCFMRRVYGVLRGVEDIVAALTCRGVWIRWRANPKGGVTLEHHVRWWAPAAWIAWVRVMIFGQLWVREDVEVKWSPEDLEAIAADMRAREEASRP